MYGEGSQVRYAPDVVQNSVGARGKYILLQFLMEVMVLSVLGGLAGIGFGIGGSKLISKFAGWQTIISFGAVALAFVFAGSVGIFFGYYPARKASLLNLIEALRYE